MAAFGGDDGGNHGADGGTAGGTAGDTGGDTAGDTAGAAGGDTGGDTCDGAGGEADGGADDPGAVVVPIEDHIDLHAFAPRDIRAVVASYLEAAIEAGFTEVRLIHGRGVGVQRASIRSLLVVHPSVVAFRDDDPLRGGWGATIVTLAPARD